jgi:uncharacterized membrane protein
MMTVPPARPLRPRPLRHRVLRLLLPASLGLNLFLGAMLVASTFHRPPPGTGLPMPERLIERVAADLPDGDAARLRLTFAGRAARFAAVQADLRQANGQLREVVAREPLDMAAVRAAIAVVRDGRRRVGDLIEDAVLAALPELSPPARMRLVGSGSP